MQNVTTFKSTPAQTNSQPLTIKIEWLVYLGLLLIVVAFRFAELDIVPISATETHNALAARNLIEGVTDTSIQANNPLIFTIQTLSFSLLGVNEFAARALTAIAGIALIFSPLLLRPRLGITRTFLLVVLLSASPVLLLASRFSSSTVWAFLLAVIGIAALWRFMNTAKPAHGILSVVAFSLMVLLADAAGFVIGLTLLLTTLITNAIEGAQQDEEATDSKTPSKPNPLTTLDWRFAFAITALIIVFITTHSMMHPQGLAVIGEMLNHGLQNLIVSQSNTPPFYALLVSLFYEPFHWILAIIGIGLALRRGLTALDRFFIVWLIIAIVTTLLYANTNAAHALWLTMPLTGLAARAIHEALAPDRRLVWHTPQWARWLLALITVVLLSIAAIGVQSIGRKLTQQLPITENSTFSIDPIGTILLLLVVMFFIVGFFLSASIWTPQTARRGGILGIAAFGMLTSFGAGWNAATIHATNPLELWHAQQATSINAPLLQSTLFEIAKREKSGIPRYPVAVSNMLDQTTQWYLRDLLNVEIIDNLQDARGVEVVILPEIIQPDLGSSYVGQHFTISQSWTPAHLNQYNFLTWALQRKINSSMFNQQSIVVWVRQDIYQGVDAIQGLSG